MNSIGLPGLLFLLAALWPPEKIVGIGFITMVGIPFLSPHFNLTLQAIAR